MTTKVIRLTTGEEIIAKVNAVEGVNLNIESPLILLPTEDGKLTFATWIPYMRDKTLDINLNTVMFMFEPVTEMADHYREATTGIKVPDKKIIV